MSTKFLDNTGLSYFWGKIKATFALISHTHASSDITAMTSYSKPNSSSAITTSDTLNQAIGKLEKSLDSLSTSNAVIKTSTNQVSEKEFLFRNVDNDALRIGGGSSRSKGANILLYGKDHSTNSGRVDFQAYDGSHYATLKFEPEDTRPTFYWLNSNGSGTEQVAYTTDLSSYVPTTRTINSKALSSNISLTASDVGAAASSHNQASNTINLLTGYSKPSSTSALSTSDTLNQALGKLEKSIEISSELSSAALNNYEATLTVSSNTSSGSNITLPGGLQYIVGSNMLLISYNGTMCYIGDQYTEVGTAGNTSTTIQILIDLAYGDKLWFRIQGYSSVSSLPNLNDVVRKSGNEIIAGQKTFSSPIVGSLAGNADTASSAPTWSNSINYEPSMLVKASDGLLYYSAAQSGPDTANNVQNPVTDTTGSYWTLVTTNSRNLVHITGTETITGSKTFGSPITGNLVGNVTGNITGNCSGSSGSCTGNANTATTLATARTINISDADGTNTGTGISFNGSADDTILLPATIKASITGDCSGTAANVTGTVAIANGGTGATTRLNALKALTNQGVTTPTHFFGMTTSWATGGYVTVANTKTVLKMTAASSSAAGGIGTVPAPAKGYQTRFLRGDATWQTVSTSSDERLKQQLADIPEEVLDAWDDAHWLQFKMNDEVEENGLENATTHTGLIVQELQKTFSDKGLDLTKYDMVVHEQWDATEAVLDENGEIEIPASPAYEQWCMRYEQALAVEAVWQRRKNKVLEKRIADLEEQLAMLLNNTNP